MHCDVCCLHESGLNACDRSHGHSTEAEREAAIAKQRVTSRPRNEVAAVDTLVGLEKVARRRSNRGLMTQDASEAEEAEEEEEEEDEEDAASESDRSYMPGVELEDAEDRGSVF